MKQICHNGLAPRFSDNNVVIKNAVNKITTFSHQVLHNNIFVRMYQTSIGAFSVIFCGTHCVASNKLVGTQRVPLIPTLHREDQPSQRQHTADTASFQRDQPIRDAVP